MGSRWTNNVTDHHKDPCKILAKGIVQPTRADTSISISSLSPPADTHLMDHAGGGCGPLSYGPRHNLDHIAATANEIEDIRALIESVYAGSLTLSNERLGLVRSSRLVECLQFEGLSRTIGLIAPTAPNVMHPEHSADHSSSSSPLSEVAVQPNLGSTDRASKSTIPQKELCSVATTTDTSTATLEPVAGYTLLTPLVHLQPAPVTTLGHRSHHLGDRSLLNDLQPGLEPSDSSSVLTATSLGFKKTLSGYMLDDYCRNIHQSNLSTSRRPIVFENPCRSDGHTGCGNVRTVEEDPSGTESEEAMDSRGRRRAKLATETPEQRRERLENEARSRRERRIQGTTDEARKRQLERNAARMRAKRAAETPEQRRIRRENEARYRRELRATETEEKRQRRLQRDSARQRANRAARSRRQKAAAAATAGVITSDPGSASTEASSSSSVVFNVKGKCGGGGVSDIVGAESGNHLAKGTGHPAAIKNEAYGAVSNYWQLTSPEAAAAVHHERVGVPSTEFVDQFVRFLDCSHGNSVRLEAPPPDGH